MVGRPNTGNCRQLCHVLALAVAKLMVREVNWTTSNMSVREMLLTAGGPGITNESEGIPLARRMPTNLNRTKQHLYEIFCLET